MGTKNYSVNRKKDGAVIFEVDGALYGDLSLVPDASDRAVLASMKNGTVERGVEKEFAQHRSVTGAADDARTRTIFLVSFGGIAAIMLLAAAILSFGVITQVSHEATSSGRVVGTVVLPGSGGSGDLTYYSYPVVGFTDLNGICRTVQVNEGSSPPAWTTGDEVTVLYDPERPKNARIDSLSSTILLWLMPGLAGIFGICFLGVTCLILRAMPAQGKQ